MSMFILSKSVATRVWTLRRVVTANGMGRVENTVLVFGDMRYSVSFRDYRFFDTSYGREA